jgi:hypothetical protein
VATATDIQGNPVSGVPIDFTVTGINPLTASVYTDLAGEAAFAYKGFAPGTDTVLASVASLSDTALVNWTSLLPTITVTAPADGSQLMLGDDSPHRSGQSWKRWCFDQSCHDQWARSMLIPGGFQPVTVAPARTNWSLLPLILSAKPATRVTVLGQQCRQASRASICFRPWCPQASREHTRTSLNDRPAVYRVGHTEHRPVRGRYALLVGIDAISDPSVRVYQPDGCAAPRRKDPVLRLQRSCRMASCNRTVSGSRGTPSTTRKRNRWCSWPEGTTRHASRRSWSTEIVAGRQYTHAASATDPEGDPALFQLASSPEGLSWWRPQAASRRPRWRTSDRTWSPSRL